MVFRCLSSESRNAEPESTWSAADEVGERFPCRNDGLAGSDTSAGIGVGHVGERRGASRNRSTVTQRQRSVFDQSAAWRWFSTRAKIRPSGRASSRRTVSSHAKATSRSPRARPCAPNTHHAKKTTAARARPVLHPGHAKCRGNSGHPQIAPVARGISGIMRRHLRRASMNHVPASTSASLRTYSVILIAHLDLVAQRRMSKARHTEVVHQILPQRMPRHPQATASANRREHRHLVGNLDRESESVPKKATAPIPTWPAAVPAAVPVQRTGGSSRSPRKGSVS